MCFPATFPGQANSGRRERSCGRRDMCGGLGSGVKGVDGKDSDSERTGVRLQGKGVRGVKWTGELAFCGYRNERGGGRLAFFPSRN